jgi:hypothetical protein
VKRTLTLKREALTELASGDLAGVVGAAQAPQTTPVEDCYVLNTKFVCWTAAAGYSRCVCPTEV